MSTPKVLAPNNRRFTAWHGGRVLAGMQDFPEQCVFAEDYEESGFRDE
jgi:actin-related protein